MSRCLPWRHQWVQCSVHLHPTTFPGNAVQNLSVAIVTGDLCAECSTVRTPTKLDKVRWPVAQ